MQNSNFTPSLLGNNNNNSLNSTEDVTTKANEFFQSISSIQLPQQQQLMQQRQQPQQQQQQQQHQQLMQVPRQLDQFSLLPQATQQISQDLQSTINYNADDNERFILRSVVSRLALPILMDEKVSKYFSNNSNLTLTVENQASQLPYAIIEIKLDKSRVIPIGIFLSKIINGKPIAAFLSDVHIKDVPKNFVYQSKFLLPVEFFNGCLRNEELNKMVRQTLISISILPDCDEVLIRVSPNSLKSFFVIILQEIESNFGSVSKFNEKYYNNESVNFKKFHKNSNAELFSDKIVLKSYYCGSLFRNFANFKYTLRTKSDCNLKIQRILKSDEKSKDDDICFTVYGPYQHNVEFAIKMIENYTKKYAHLKLNQEFDNKKG